MEDCLDTTYEITKLIQRSPKREVIFRKLAEEIQAGSPGIRTLCPTRWTVRADAFASISENYQALQATWDSAKQVTKDTEMKARIIGVALQMQKFDYFFGIELGRKCLLMVDNLSRSLQATRMSACEGQSIVKKTVQSLQAIRSDGHFSLFWKYLEQRSSKMDMSNPALPRRKRVPRRLEVGEGAPEYAATVEDHYRRIYFEVIDLLLGAIQERFGQKGFQVLQKLEAIIVENSPSEETIREVAKFYGPDFHQERLKSQLSVLHSHESLNDLQSVVSHLKSLNDVEREFYSEVVKVVKLILVMPATNALSERSFSCLRRIKTSTCGQVRLNSCMTVHERPSTRSPYGYT